MTITSRQKAVNTRQTEQLVNSSNQILIENRQTLYLLIVLNSHEEGVKIGEHYSILSSDQASDDNGENPDSLMVPLPSAKAASRVDKTDDNLKKATLNHELPTIVRQASKSFSYRLARGFSSVLEGFLLT
jgi:hypothetical protein